MKKTLLLFIAGLILSQPANAQFPYASIWSDYTPTYSLTSGMATTNTPGFLWSGYQPSLTLGGFSWFPNNMNFFIKGTGSSSIWASYKIFEGNGGNCSGSLTQVLNGAGVSMIEINSSSNNRYAVAGAYDKGCFYTRLSTNGTPVNSRLYNFPVTSGTNSLPPTKPLIIEDHLTNDFFIVGAQQGEVYVLRIDPAGNMIWSSSYKILSESAPTDILMNPYSPNSLVIVGTAKQQGSDEDGFFMEIDGSQGTVGILKTFGSPGKNDAFNAITAGAGISSINGSGYVIGGSSQLVGNSTQAWILKLDQTGGILWTNLLQPASGHNQGFVDVIERLNTFNNYEYYGALKSGAGMVVVKLNDMGQPFPISNSVTSNEFVYNLPGNIASSPAALSQVKGPANAPDVGIQVYGTSYHLSFANSGYVVSAYYNGETNCNKTMLVQNQAMQGPQQIINRVAAKSSGLSSCNNFQVQAIFAGGSINYPCSGFMSNGSNLRGMATGIGESEDKKSGLLVYPNPVNDITTVSYSAADYELVEIDLYNTLGQLVKPLVRSAAAQNENFSEVLDFREMGLESGIYFITCRINGIVQKQKIIYNK